MSAPMDTAAVASVPAAVPTPTPAPAVAHIDAAPSDAPASAESTSAAPAAPVAAAPAAAKKGGAGRGRNWANQERNNKRQKNNGSTQAGESGDAAGDEDDVGGGAGKKRKVALAVMYRGTAYCGLQIQNGDQGKNQRTIERELMDAIFAAGGISKENMNDTIKIKWVRSARTDKGVHAAGNILSLMLIPDGPPPADCLSQSADIVERINAHLPTDIRVIAWCRTLAGFHAKYQCTSRVYEYIIPSFVFDDHPDTVSLMHATEDVTPGESGAPFVYPERLLNYRLTPEKMSSLREILSHFKGTRNYQNFTRKKSGFLKDLVRERPKFAFQDRNAAGESAENANDQEGERGNQRGKSKRGNKDDASEDEGEGMDDAQEEAFERQQFAARQAAAAASASAAAASVPADGAPSSGATAATPFVSPFAVARGADHLAGLGTRHHNPLFTHLKATSNSKGGDPHSQTNKVSGQYARFIRYIMDFDVEATYLHTISNADGTPASGGLELVRFRIHGQSFMLNQIRKMIGMLIVVARGQLPLAYITEKAFKFDNYSVPTAPSLGLLLQRPVYDAYDARIKDTPDRSPIGDLFLSEANRARVDAFREEMIYKQIGDAEVATASAFHWCSRLWDNPARVQHQAEEDAAKEEESKPQEAAADTNTTTTTTASESVVPTTITPAQQELVQQAAP